MNELHDRVRGARIFNKLDLTAGYNLLRRTECDECKSAFQSRHGHYQYIVMPFSLANTSATFKNMINKIFKDLIDHGAAIYLDDILIYGRNVYAYIALTKKVLERLQELQLAQWPEKCEWHMSKGNFLGYLISEYGIEMDQEKVKTVEQWEEPTTMKEVQSFLRFAHFYRQCKGGGRMTKSLKAQRLSWDVGRGYVDAVTI